MASTFNLNRADVKSAFIAILIAAAGGIYWMRRSSTGSSLNPFKSGPNAQSAANGTAGAIAPSSSINTYNVFPTVSSQLSSPTSFYNGRASNTTPSIVTGGSGSTSTGQHFSLPMGG